MRKGAKQLDGLLARRLRLELMSIGQIWNWFARDVISAEASTTN